MKLSKANEETLKGLAALLKMLKSDDIVIMTSGTSQLNEEANKLVLALEKDLRQLRKNLKELPEPEMANAEFAPPSKPEDWMRVLVFKELKERLALPDGDEARIGPAETLRELNEIDCRAVNHCAKIDLNGPAVWLTKEGRAFGRVSDEQIEVVLREALTDVQERSGLKDPINLDTEAIQRIRTKYAKVFGPLPDAMMSNDIDSHILELIQQHDPDKAEGIEPQVGQIESEFEEKPFIFVNEEQASRFPTLIGCRPTAQGVFALPLYRKKT
jgi:hypothetical protein